MPPKRKAFLTLRGNGSVSPEPCLVCFASGLTHRPCLPIAPRGFLDLSSLPECLALRWTRKECARETRGGGRSGSPRPLGACAQDSLPSWKYCSCRTCTSAGVMQRRLTQPWAGMAHEAVKHSVSYLESKNTGRLGGSVGCVSASRFRLRS